MERQQAERELRNSREQLRNLSSHLESVREEERTRLARKIHDELGQALTALKMDISWLIKHRVDEEGSVLKKTRSMESLLDATIELSNGCPENCDRGFLTTSAWRQQLSGRQKNFRIGAGSRAKLW